MTVPYPIRRLATSEVGTQTIKDGAFRMEEVPQGAYTLTLRAQGYSMVPSPQQIEVKPGETIEIPLKIER